MFVELIPSCQAGNPQCSEPSVAFLTVESAYRCLWLCHRHAADVRLELEHPRPDVTDSRTPPQTEAER